MGFPSHDTQFFDLTMRNIGPYKKKLYSRYVSEFVFGFEEMEEGEEAVELLPGEEMGVAATHVGIVRLLQTNTPRQC